jgi:hypothetical protein
MVFSAKINTCCGNMQNKHQHVVLYAISSFSRDSAAFPLVWLPTLYINPQHTNRQQQYSSFLESKSVEIKQNSSMPLSQVVPTYITETLSLQPRGN